jgi:fibro-slime domain-containing protein
MLAIKMQTQPEAKQNQGFILVFTLIMLLGISVIGLAMMSSTKQDRFAARNYMHQVQSFYASDGMMSLLADEVLNDRDTVYTYRARRGTITGKLWHTSGHYGIESLRAKYNSGLLGSPIPIQSNSLGSFFHDRGYLGDLSFQNDYGVFWNGFLYAPITGSYTFYIRADDQAEFFLSADDTPGALASDPLVFAFSPMSTSLWPSPTNQPTGPNFHTVSTPVFLEGGKRYYFELYHKENGGNDFGQVGWTGPEWISEKPIPSTRLANYDSTHLSQRQDTTLVGNTPVIFGVESMGANVFSLSTLGFAAMAGSDTLFQIPLHQRISTKGTVTAPPETTWSKAIFYDYHSDKSNPEFESPPWGVGGGSPHLGMVSHNKLEFTNIDANYFGLDSIGKPIGTGSNDSVFYSCAIDRWFKPWVAGSAKNKNVPRSNPGSKNDCTVTTTTIDTLYKNMRIYDSLPFTRLQSMGNNAYQFSRIGNVSDSGFFWLDGKGFGAEGRSRNFSFCMEMHTQFELVPGMEFNFKGDDDVWLFINNKLVMDMGGLHVSLGTNIFFDDLGLENFKDYPFDFFYCERQTTESHLQITTNVPLTRGKGKVSLNWKRDYGVLD